MSEFLDRALDGEPQPEEAPTVEPVEVAVEPPAETSEVPEAEAETPPTGDGNDKRVPLAALEKVRAERTDWKEKALLAQGRLEQLERDRAQAQQRPDQSQQPQRPLDPQEMVINERFNVSELLAREKYADMDEKLSVFQEAMAQNPALQGQMFMSKHPWEFAYKEAQRILAQREIGDDPSAYRSKIEAELRAKWEAERAQTTPAPAPAVHLPASLAGVRSTAARTAPAFTGPTPLEDIVNKR